jgi:hypothetical protein
MAPGGEIDREGATVGLDAIVADMNGLALVPWVLSLGPTHAHRVAQFGALKIRPTVGRLKSRATQAIPNPENRRRVWAEGCHMKSLNDEAAFRNAVAYVRHHTAEGSLVFEWHPEPKPGPRGAGLGE